MILLLGKNIHIEKYVDEVLKLDPDIDISYMPYMTMHYSDYPNYIKWLKQDKPKIITTQSLEMIQLLLESDLDFDVITVKFIDNELKDRKLSKEKAHDLYYLLGVELR